MRSELLAPSKLCEGQSGKYWGASHPGLLPEPFMLPFNKQKPTMHQAFSIQPLAWCPRTVGTQFSCLLQQLLPRQLLWTRKLHLGILTTSSTQAFTCVCVFMCQQEAPRAWEIPSGRHLDLCSAQ